MLCDDTTDGHGRGCVLVNIRWAESVLLVTDSQWCLCAALQYAPYAPSSVVHGHVTDTAGVSAWRSG